MQGDVFGVVVPRNSPIPCNKSRTFTTVEDNQTTVTFPVYEGERVTCKENRLLGEFELSGITPQPRGQAELICTFEIDANGLLKVSALDRTSGRRANISITNSVGRLSSSEIDQMIKDAETFKQADKDFTAKVRRLSLSISSKRALLTFSPFSFPPFSPCFLFFPSISSAAITTTPSSPPPSRRQPLPYTSNFRCQSLFPIFYTSTARVPPGARVLHCFG
jgi:hypothetical protein